MKRKRKATRDGRAVKRVRTEDDATDRSAWPLLRYYYPKVVSLREYLVSRLAGSKKRQRRIFQYGTIGSQTNNTNADPAIIELLDNIVVGSFDHVEPANSDSIEKDATLFTQQLSASDSSITPTQGAFKQSEIVDFIIWLIFKRQPNSYKPSHILAHGFQRFAGGPNGGAEAEAVPGVPGIWSTCKNPHVEALRAQPWTALPSLLGRRADSILGGLLLNCGIFRPVVGNSNLTQLSGVPLCDLKPLQAACLESAPHPTKRSEENPFGTSKPGFSKLRGLSDIRFVRHRMLYAKAISNGKGNVSFGLGHAHVLNKHPDVSKEEQNIHVLKYIFPQQFGLHNVLTSDIDYKDTALTFKDYTLREQEIHRADLRWKRRKLTENNGQSVITTSQPLPKRLRGEILGLVLTTRRRHLRCSYRSLLDYYCPMAKQDLLEKLIDQATPVAQVSVFCRAVVWKVFPARLFGIGETGVHNRKLIMRNIDKILRRRRYETMSLHDVLHDFRIQGVPWVQPGSIDGSSKMSRTDFCKRQELIAELIYYLFDSFLTPLIRGHFYATESGLNRNQLFYFRQDVWLKLSQPVLASIKDAMLEPCATKVMKRNLRRRDLGVSRLRLLPKEQGMRPIINLRRRVQHVQNGRPVLGKSINSILTPTFSILNLEKVRRPDVLGSALFSVEDIFPRLQAFRLRLQESGMLGNPLFFAKVDVRACFDTIPQKRLMQLARSILDDDVYQIARYSRAKLVGGCHAQRDEFAAKPVWRYLTKATAGARSFDFSDTVACDTAEGRTRTVYVDGVMQKSEQRRDVLDLLEEHVGSNLIQLGRTLYRQKQGIPQGSIISSLLCSYFYAELERSVLGFVNNGQSILLRLIDDFLVISTDRAVAERFVHVMHGGIPEFGVEVKVEKSKVNFDIEINGTAVDKLPSETRFPYCGNAIDTVTLDLSKDKERRKNTNIQDSVTVEYSKSPGQTFYRKILNCLKLQMQNMLMSTSYNSVATVLSNLQHCFIEVAAKTLHYIRTLPSCKQPPCSLVIKAVDDLVELACALMKRRKRGKYSNGAMTFECCITKAQTRWFGYLVEKGGLNLEIKAK